MPDQVANAIATIIEYLWSDEAKDYLAKNREQQQAHIFNDLITDRQWLDRRRSQASKQTTKRPFGPNDNS
jgi:hypothetical protein